MVFEYTNIYNMFMTYKASLDRFCKSAGLATICGLVCTRTERINKLRTPFLCLINH